VDDEENIDSNKERGFMTSSYKKIFYRATHRGTKELDLIMIRFMNNVFEKLTQEEREKLEILVNEDDEILNSWVVGNFVDKL
jgi:succinate dehydrogenase flavin-adding protein (antitoxin of CptAB toxin-antitoxin module)